MNDPSIYPFISSLINDSKRTGTLSLSMNGLKV